MSLSVLIYTKNEEVNLSDCLHSLSWSDDIHIFDSGSTDRTLDIANTFDVTITQKKYEILDLPFGGDEAAHRNWALQNIPFKYKWILHLDADERTTPDLVKEIYITLPNTTHSAFKIIRRDFFMNRWLRHVQASPYFIRLFNKNHVTYERLINPVAKVDGTIGTLNSYFDHYPFSKGISHWLEKHNGYSSLESKQIVNNRINNSDFSITEAIFQNDFHMRRYHQKELFYRLPFRPFIKFFLLYFGKMGFLDGKAGFTYATLQSIYEYFIILKTRELESSKFHSLEK